MKKLNIYWINAFTTSPFKGNPAAVVMNDDLSDSEMHRIASEMKLSETAFLSRSAIADYKLRWMTPKIEVNLCGHATIASLHYLKETGALPENSAVRFETLSGIIKCCDEKDYYYMQIPRYNINPLQSNMDKILAALGLNEYEISGDPLLLENGYLYLNVKHIKKLGDISPDLEAIKNLTSNSDIRALVPYSLQTLEIESTAHLRFFDPGEGIDEDPVTGSACGPLCDILIHTGDLPEGDHEIQIEQGDFIGRPGRVKVLHKNKQLFIAGKAFTFLKGEFFI